MKKLAVSPAINPHALTPEAKETLTDELYRVQSEVFSGVDREGFYNYVIAPQTYKTRIYKFQNRQKETVGYITFHVYETRIPKAGKLKTVYVIRTETGVLKAYRGRTPLFPILFRESFKFWFGKGMPEAYFMATPISSRSFCPCPTGIWGVVSASRGRDTGAYSSPEGKPDCFSWPGTSGWGGKSHCEGGLDRQANRSAADPVGKK